MADIELVIKIPEETYEYWKEHKYEYVLAEAIANGVPLPKGHGRLIDADELENEIFHGGLTYYEKAKLIIDNAPTIIEADEVEE